MTVIEVKILPKDPASIGAGWPSLNSFRHPVPPFTPEKIDELAYAVGGCRPALLWRIQLRLGDAHLCPTGLSENWLWKEWGHRH